MELTQEQWLQSIWMALHRIETNLALPPAPLELPDITLAPPDLTGIVTAVQSLNGTGPTAEDIAAAIRDVLAPQAAPATGAEELGAVARALEKLDFRLQGMGRQAYGGGSVSLQPNQSISVANQLIPTAYDRIDLTYTGTDVTGVVYRLAGNVVATLTLTYADGNLTRVVRT